MKEIWKKTILKWLIILFLIAIVAISFYIVALIIQDTITAGEAEAIGYIAAIVNTGLIVATLLLITFNEEEKKELILQHEIDARKLMEFEAELERLKKIK